MGATASGKLNQHTWRVRCTEKQLTLLSLTIYSVSLTHQADLEAEVVKLNSELATIKARLAEIQKEING